MSGAILSPIPKQSSEFDFCPQQNDEMVTGRSCLQQNGAANVQSEDVGAEGRDQVKFPRMF